MNARDEAVEAAARTIEACLEMRVPLGETARAALEAAYPHLIAPILALADEADNRPGSMYCKVTTNQLRAALGVTK